MAHSLAFVSARGALLARLPGDFAASGRFVERAGKLPRPNRFQDRVGLIDRIIGSLRTNEEKMINEAGVLTRRQAAEQSFWGRLAYHCYREYGEDCVFRPAVEESSGDFILKCSSRNAEHLLELTVPRRQVRKVLGLLAAQFASQADLAIHPVPLRSISLVSEKTRLDLEIRPVIQALQSSGETRFYDSGEYAKFRYGDLVYVREMNLLAELKRRAPEESLPLPSLCGLKRANSHRFLTSTGMRSRKGC